ncbi:uncharacterized protein BYT42DRAFT_611752 [Radiomyces spectabilis]|uniref:uncharacterized protein n=1 Tax=Radiomyces spectabilis TaxID=64574 RepID=UPI0022208E5F|nr:uncharacterized protein BYT42DRAFT_611752 [Radiomyces spectabilis]KAI8388748.1 hypothetical protein BYT42DRAFT_611752 [Radiomyces spectabilis]
MALSETSRKRKRASEDDTLPSPSCPICLQIYVNRTFLRPCYHSFCFSCIRHWINILPSCPLCKQVIECLIYNIDDDKNTFQEYQLSTKADDEKHDPPLQLPSLTAEERQRIRRAKIYRTPIPAISYPKPLPRLKEVKYITPEHIPRIEPFLRKELPALMGDYHDSFIETHVKHILLMPHEKHRQKSTAAEPVTEDFDMLKQLAEWINDESDTLTVARRFVVELMAFLRSGLNYRTFISNTEYAEQTDEAEASTERENVPVRM